MAPTSKSGDITLKCSGYQVKHISIGVSTTNIGVLGSCYILGLPCRSGGMGTPRSAGREDRVVLDNGWG